MQRRCYKVALPFLSMAVLALVSGARVCTAADNVINEGVEPGKFTQDHAAATAYAAEKKLPMLLVFTGSDWCGWCKMMDKDVFSQPDWAAYAKDSLVCIWLDFPRNKDLVPEAFRERNDALRKQYGVQGYPTYFVLDHEGRQIGRFGAGKGKTPASVQAEIERFLRNTRAGIEKRCAEFSPEDAAKVRAELEKREQAAGNLEETLARVNKLRQEAAELEKAARDQVEVARAALQAALEAGTVNRMSPERRAEYQSAKDALAAANEAMEAWLEANRGKPKTEALGQEQSALKKAYEDARAKMDAFE